MLYRYVECHCAVSLFCVVMQCHYSVSLCRVIMLFVVMQCHFLCRYVECHYAVWLCSVIILCVVMLNVVAPWGWNHKPQKYFLTKKNFFSLSFVTLHLFFESKPSIVFVIEYSTTNPFQPNYKNGIRVLFVVTDYCYWYSVIKICSNYIGKVISYVYMCKVLAW